MSRKPIQYCITSSQFQFSQSSHHYINLMPNQPSPLWKHFVSPNLDFRKAQCIHCGVVVNRGPENAPKSKCINRSMQVHMEKAHSDLMEEISREQALMKKPKDVDTRNETVRGTMKIFNLRSQAERAEFIKMVRSITIICFIFIPYCGG